MPSTVTNNAAAFARGNELMLTSEGEAHLRPDLSVRDYFDVLRANRCLADARRVLAHALPKRRSLWWGLLCAWDVFRGRPAENAEAVLRGIGDFVCLPTETNRQALRGLVDLVRPQSPPHYLAHAAILSFGSLTDAPLPEVLPKPFLTGRLVGVSIYLASVAREQLKYESQLESYLDLGLEVARGTNLWTTATPQLSPATEVLSALFAESLILA
jgi:hypothetical protein